MSKIYHLQNTDYIMFLFKGALRNFAGYSIITISLAYFAAERYEFDVVLSVYVDTRPNVPDVGQRGTSSLTEIFSVTLIQVV